MKVSVIVPVFNTEKYIRRCLDSLVHQTLDEVEIIVVNDGSQDQSQKIIDEFTKKYSNIKTLRKANGGLSDARNYGMSVATGEYIAFVDSDDYVELNMFEAMYTMALEENLDIVVCDTVIEYDDHSYILHSNMHFTEDVVCSYIYASPMACTRLVSHSVMECFSFQKGILYEDLNLTPTYITKTNRVGFLESPLYHYIQRNDSIMNQRTFNKRLLDIFRVLENVKKTFGQNGILLQYHDEIEYLYLIHLLRSATLRFLQYEDTQVYLKQIVRTMQLEFPNWQKNKYLKQSNIKFRLVCSLAASGRYNLLKMLNAIKK